MKNHIAITGVIIMALLFLVACEGSLNERIKKATGTIHEANKATQEITKAANELSKKADAYADTTIYKKDSTGRWQKK
jgi:uncharacterized protein YoxC